MPKYPIPSKEEIEQLVKNLEIDISKYNELKKNCKDKSVYFEIVNYLCGQRTAFLYVLGHTKDLY